jgi:uncharacterized membrane protein
MREVIFTIFDCINFGLVAFLWWLTIKNYKTLPQRIPVHFDLDGKADHFGNKAFIFLMPVMGMLLYLIFMYITRHPESSNFPVEITESNKEAQFLIMTIFLRWILMLVLFIFLNSQDLMVRYAFDENAKPKASVATMLFSVLGSVLVVVIIAAQFK